MSKKGIKVKKSATCFSCGKRLKKINLVKVNDVFQCENCVLDKQNEEVCF